MKEVYKKHERGNRTYTQESKDALNEIDSVLKPLFAKYIELGYEPTDIFYLMSVSIHELVLDEVLGLNN